MSPFNYEKALMGGSVCTRYGYPASILVEHDGTVTVTADYEEIHNVWALSADGMYMDNKRESPWDLFMADDEVGDNTSVDSEYVIGINDEIAPELKSKRISDW